MPSRDELDMDRLAEKVAQHGRIGTAARQIGVSKFRADALWAQIIHQIGRQAQ